MASVFAHAVAGAALWPLFKTTRLPSRAWIAGSVLAVIPDVDVVGFQRGVPYGSMFGHRGFTHSILFALCLGSLALFAIYHRGRWSQDRAILGAYLVVAAASHGLIDAMTNGGLGVALLSPFDTTRYFFPWRPIAVSPIGVRRFFSSRGAAVLANEFVWVGLPSLTVATVTAWIRSPRRANRKRAA